MGIHSVDFTIFFTKISLFSEPIILVAASVTNLTEHSTASVSYRNLTNMFAFYHCVCQDGFFYFGIKQGLGGFFFSVVHQNYLKAVGHNESLGGNSKLLNLM